jgi:hypothetical protein
MAVARLFVAIIALGLVALVVASWRASGEFGPIRDLARQPDGTEVYILDRRVQDRQIPTYLAHPQRGTADRDHVILTFTSPLFGEGRMKLTDEELPALIQVGSPAWTMISKTVYENHAVFEVEIKTWSVLDITRR